jgi:hypothetical protein
MGFAEELVQLIKVCSQMRLQSHIEKPDCSVDVLDISEANPDLGIWLSSISVNRPNLRIILNVSYNLDGIKSFVASNVAHYLGVESDETGFDFMNEFCNIVAGLIQKQLSENGISSRVGIPMISRGYDDYYLLREEASTEAEWLLGFADQHLHVKTYLTFSEDPELKSFKYSNFTESTQEVDDIFEF